MKKVLLILLLLPLLFFCAKNKSQKNRGNIVRIPIGSPIRSFDPRISNVYPSAHIINMLYEGLMRLGPNGEILPGAAESVTISEDQTVYTFYLRDSIWSNGDPVTAYDFEYAWKKSIDPMSAEAGAFTFYVIKHAKACLKGEKKIDDVGVKALNEKTLRVELSNPTPYFLSLCACTTYSPVHRKSDLNCFEWMGEKNNLICNGPFILKSLQRGVELFLEKNPLYWDVDTVKIRGISVQIVPDAATQFFLFEKGKFDWVGHPFNGLPSEILEDCHRKEILKSIDAEQIVWYFLNTEKPPFKNKNFRKALAYAMDRQKIADYVFALGETPAVGICKGLMSKKNPYFKDANLKTAQTFLQKALEEMGLTKDELPPITLTQESSNTMSQVNQAVQQQISQALGVKVEINQSDFPVHFKRLSLGNYEFGSLTWVSWIKDPIYMLDTFRDRSLATNMSRWEHPDYQALLKKADRERDPVARMEYLRQAEALLMEEMPVIPLCFTRLHYLSNESLKGVYVSPLREIEFRYAYFSEED
ncbi:peptide ABC transporter substrate-binding protein [Candidatus Neptunochlamydia vexilliferae]|nr:peptide ABC transporter substrate-binding protein [Candidatus Neptunochlamydia vexilliferae]